MSIPHLLHDLPLLSANRFTDRAAVAGGYPADRALSYGDLAANVLSFQSAMTELALQRGSRIAVFLEKRVEFVVACFGATAAGAAMVPLNPALKPAQVVHVLEDARPAVLVTSFARWQRVAPELNHGKAPRWVVLVDAAEIPPREALPLGVDGLLPSVLLRWADLMRVAHRPTVRVLETDLAAILYTSGSTGGPKGVMLSHRNLVVGARSVVEYLGNTQDDTLLAALPLSFDAGFSQLTTAFTVGAKVVLHDHLFPADLVRVLQTERITGLTAVPPLLHQLCNVEWPAGLDEHLRYVASTGGPMPARTLSTIRTRLPRSRVFIMYGLTEAFRSTYLPPEQLDTRPGSIGKAIPNVEVLVLRPDGQECGVDEPGELVHRGPLVGLGYWGDPQRTAQRWKPLPDGLPWRAPGLVAGAAQPEMAVYSGDVVRRDAEGFLYHLGRADEMIKTSGYRVSPSEVEDVLLASGAVAECAVFGVADEALGQRLVAAVVLAASPEGGDLDAAKRSCRQALPSYMVPTEWMVVPGALPRNLNGKVDRVELRRLHEDSKVTP
jgi:acyl-CoA ligase (AMP-forming) (exosortase A-associated)